jgi:hypothetical protein
MTTTTSALDKLITFARQRPRLEFANYGDIKPYRQEAYSILKQLHRFNDLLREAYRVGVADADVIEAAPHAYSGRLEWNGEGWDYCTGQYFPTEYRQAAAAVLDRAIHSKKQSQADTIPTPRFQTVSDIRAYHEQTGSHWFDRSSMRFFGTKIHGNTLIKGRYFITSEQPPHGPRGYTVREVSEDGDIKTVGELCGYRTARDARHSIRKGL